MLGKDNVKVADFPKQGGRGLSAAKNIQPGETILAVPISELITVHRIKTDLNPLLA